LLFRSEGINNAINGSHSSSDEDAFNSLIALLNPSSYLEAV